VPPCAPIVYRYQVKYKWDVLWVSAHLLSP